MRAAVREAPVQALRRLRRALTEPGLAEGVDAARAWKLFLLAPRMLLTRTDQHGSQGRAELLGRASAFQRGDWLQLLQAARRACRPAQDAPPTDPAAIAERKRHQACFKVKQGELSRARQVLTTCDLAPGTEATWAALTDPVRRPPEPRTTIGEDVLHHQPRIVVLVKWFRGLVGLSMFANLRYIQHNTTYISLKLCKRVAAFSK